MLFVALLVVLTTTLYWFYKTSTEFKKWVKLVISYFYLRWTKKGPLFPFSIKTKDLGQLGVVSLPIAWTRDSPRQLLPDIHASDSIRLWGVNNDGILLYIHFTRRQNRMTELIFQLRMEDDVYQLPIHPDTNIYNTDGKTFATSGLTLDILEPLRKWRVHFDGYLRRVSDNKITTAKFNFICQPLSNYTSYPEDFNEKYIAKYLSTSDLNACEIYNKMCLEKHITFVQLFGVIEIEGQKQLEVNLRGAKDRSFGKINWKTLNHLVFIEVYLKKGTSMGIYIENNPDGVKKFVHGYYSSACNQMLWQMSECKLDMDAICSKNCPSQIDINFVIGKKKCVLKLKSRGKPLKTFMGENRESVSLLHLCEAEMNGNLGDGIVHFFSNQMENDTSGFPAPMQQYSLPLLTEPEIESCKELVVTFDDPKCRSSNIVGGKGASLALMTTLTAASHKKFIVPPGVGVTKTAFRIHVEQNPKIEKELEKLQNLAKSLANGPTAELETQCNEVVKLISNTPVSTRLKEELTEKLKEKFGEDFETIRFAVRSSAIGEDGEEMSAAGQNETFLGVKGLNQMVDRLCECWASQFAFRSVEYKRHNAQLLNAGMGVVIQQMVAAEVAGVLFSRHPLTGSATRMVITANYGLGESVVAASADPDTISIRRLFDDQLAVEEISTGSKKTLIRMSEEAETEEKETEAELASQCCLSEAAAIQLAKIAIFLEKCFGNGRDIEWAIYQQRVYILQSRPVTTNSALTEFDVMHEFDTPMKTDNEFYSTANVGEVMPGSQTPLTVTSVLRGQIPFFQKLFQWKMDVYKYDPLVNDGMGTFFGHVMFDLVQQKAWSLSKEKTAIMKAFDIGIYGHVLEDSEILKRALDRFEIPPPFRQRMLMSFYSLKGMAMGQRLLNRASKIYTDYRIPITGVEDALECHRIIGTKLTDIFPIMNTHMSVTMASTMWNMITLNILSQGKGEYSNDQYSDFALLVGSANGAESGNVPASLGELAEVISRAEDLKEFAKWEPQEALDKLVNSSDEIVKKKFQEFLTRHGHRGLKEFDMSCVSWGINPKQVIVVLQGMLTNIGHAAQKAQEKSWEETMQNLKTSLTPFKKWMLKFIMKFCRCGVCYREKAKSMVIKYYDATRLAYRHLARLMMKEGLILNEDLIFFFTHEEIEQLIRTRSPKYIRRAKLRQKVHKITDKYRFAEMITGRPKPINQSNLNISAVDEKTIVKGVPVSQGVIQGVARVVNSFHDVHTIKPGEILITHATDIGWSPYFPMLHGIVTEIGGLISHGAVVAREFGLPCIVGVDNATKLFQSGDVVLLNATQGTIMKVGQKEDAVIANGHH